MIGCALESGENQVDTADRPWPAIGKTGFRFPEIVLGNQETKPLGRTAENHADIAVAKQRPVHILVGRDPHRRVVEDRLVPFHDSACDFSVCRHILCKMLG
jgi:hypothetical protein